MKRYYRVNERIRAPKVRLIDPKGKQVGVVSLSAALEKAKKAGLDLVEIAPKVRPPVCKILDFKKFLLEQKEKRREARKKSHKVELKQFRLRPNIDQNDLQLRINRAKKFLEEGNQVKLVMLFRGREITHREVGEEKIKVFVEGVADVGKITKEPKLKGKVLTLTMGPK